MSGIDRTVQGEARATNVAKLSYQASRAARGLGTSTRLTAALDLSTGIVSAEGAQSAAQAWLGTGNAAKAANTFTRLSADGKLVSFASKAAPVLAKGTAVLGAAIGGFEIAQGVDKLAHGQTSAGRDKLIDGGCDVVTAGALYVAGGAAATGVGAPVAAVALGVAAGATALKLGWDYRHEIGHFAQEAGSAVSRGYHKLEGLFKP